MKLINSWRRPEFSQPMADRIAAAFRPLHADGVWHVELWSEDHLPFIEIYADRIVRPVEVLDWGKMLAETTGMPVYFHSLTPNAATFLLKSDILAGPDEDFDASRADDYGNPLADIMQSWTDNAAINEAEQVAEEQVIMNILNDPD